MDRYADLSRLAATQEGHVAAWQCRLLDLPKEWIHDQTRRRSWTAVHRGVHRLAGVPTSWRSDVWAALLSTAVVKCRRGVEDLTSDDDRVFALREQVATRALVTGWSAATARGYERHAPARPQLLLPQATRCERGPVCVTRTRLFPTIYEWVDGLPCVLPERMVWDIAWVGRGARGSDRSIHDLAVFLDRTRTFAVAELLAVIDEPVAFGLPRRVPSALRRAGELLVPGFSHSATEATARRIVQEVAERRGLLASSRPLAIRAGGRIIAEADIAVESLRWDIEIDGPHHDTLEMQVRDARRDGGLRSIDWVTSRYPTATLDRSPSSFAAQVDRDMAVMIERRRDQAAA